MAPPAALLQQQQLQLQQQQQQQQQQSQQQASSSSRSMRRPPAGSSSSSQQPPAQVYTMGSVGKVKTRPHNVQSVPASAISSVSSHHHHHQHHQHHHSASHHSVSSNHSASSSHSAPVPRSSSSHSHHSNHHHHHHSSNNNHNNNNSKQLERQRSQRSLPQNFSKQPSLVSANKSVGSSHGGGSCCGDTTKSCKTVRSISSNTSTTSRSSRHSHDNSTAATPASSHSGPPHHRNNGSGSGGSSKASYSGPHKAVSFDQQQQQQHAANMIDFHERHKQHVRTTRRIVEELTRAQGSYERRIAAITNACETFDHADESLHNTELHQGAAAALSRLLGLSTNDDEIRMICAALEMVFRGNPKSVQAAYERISSNNSNLLTHLLRLLARCESGNMKNARISIVNISRILLYLSRCPALRSGLARHHGLLGSLTSTSNNPQLLLSTPSSSNASPSRSNSYNLNTTGSFGSSPSSRAVANYGNNMVDCRLTRIRTIANLCKCDENKLYLYEEEGLLETVLRTAHLDQHAAARHHAAVALCELAAATHNQTAMAHDDTVLGTAVKMILMETAAQTRESVITALQNLAFSKQNRWRLVTFKQGIVLEALKKALASDVDAKARRRAAGALTNLACQQTAERIGSHKGLLDTLAFCATKDSNKDVQTRAALALTKIANGITVDMPCHAALLDALVVASLSDATNSISAVLRVKSREPENRQILARHPGILDTLSDLCLSDTSSVSERDNAVRSLMHLVNEDRNRKIMCNKTILDALVASAAYKDPDLADARDSAIRAMERLATEFTNRAYMAKHPDLLVVVAGAVEREARWEEEGEKSEHGFLAKPLLMSLLVAM